MSDIFTTADGLALARRDWPAAGAARGTVLLVHGLGEHAGRYEHLAARLAAQGWRVVGYDQRGHGASPGARGALPDGEALLRDLAAVIDAVRAERPGPLVLLGHSMGGLVAARFVAEGLRTPAAAWSRPVDALVLSSPALAADTSAGQKLLLATLGGIAPNLAVNNGLKPAWISRDAAVVAAYVADARVHDRITPRLARFILDGGALVRRLAPLWRVPTLLLWAGADRCVAPRGSAEFAAAAPAGMVQAQDFPALYHEIFNEPERDAVIERLTGWLARVG
ncbi:lysophospholipase [Piscinibacter sp.]|uniref:alpha/beta hydrolase n=1 Tax=Piscinibacter sp. TaxID=1903157 RepID=UPI0039E6B292